LTKKFFTSSVLISAAASLSGREQGFVHMETSEGVRFFLPFSEIALHLGVAAIILLFALLTTSLVKKKNAVRSVLYFALTVFLFVAGAVNLYYYYAKKSFVLEIRPESFRFQTFKESRSVPWESISELRKQPRFALPGPIRRQFARMPNWIPFAAKLSAYKIIDRQGKAIVTIPNEFSKQELEYFLGVLQRKNIPITETF